MGGATSIDKNLNIDNNKEEGPIHCSGLLFSISCMHKVTWIFILLLNITIKIFAQHAADTSGIIQFVFTSDAHYGITRSNFRGTVNADAHAVNTAMLEKINSISAVMLPQDSGVNGGHVAGAVDFLVEGGDIANRMEIPIQSATVSWGQFETDYLKGSKLIDHSGDAAKFFRS